MRELADVHRAVGEDRPVSLDEAIALRERLVSRRRVLQAGGAAAAAVLMPPFARRFERRTPGDPRIVVVGAGLAGLSCAFKLAQHGLAADVYEGRDRVGGRCWTARGFAAGQVAEHGGEFIDTRHHQLRRLIATLGLELEDLFAAYDEEAPTSGLLVLDGAVRRPSDVYADIDLVIRRLARAADRIGPYRWGQAGPQARAFDRVTMRAWMDRHVPGGSGSLLGRAMDVNLTGFWGIDPDDTSAITLLDTYITPYPGGAADERYHVRGGNDQVPALLADRLAAGSIHLETPLRAIVERADGSFALTFDGTAGDVVADVVVLTLPFTTLREVDLSSVMLTRKRRRSIDELGMGTNAKVLLPFDRRLTRLSTPSGRPWNGYFLADDPQGDSWDSSLGQPGSTGLLTVYSGGARGASYPATVPHGPAPGSVVDEALGFLDRWMPGSAAAYGGDAWLDSWVDDPWVRGSYAAFLPGQWTAYFGYLGRPAGNVHFAGEHTSTYSQGYLNGGVESGLRAAREVLRDAGRA
jgi:monoamine oxidase